MSANFDWQTEENDRQAQNIWDEPLEPKDKGPGRRRLPWRLITVVVVLVVMIGGLVWWRIDRQVDATLQAFRTDVVASHNLAQRAVAEDDEEVFRSVLSGRMPVWTASVMEVFQARLFVDRSPLGLIPEEESLPAILRVEDEEIMAGERVADIEFSADLNEALVTIDQPYQIEGTGQTIVLQQTTLFRRGDSRWLMAPPLDDFWGGSATVAGDYLTVIYPARDKAVAERLAAYLDYEIGRMCNTLEGVYCSADLHLTIRLSTDPAALASLSQPLGALRRAREREDILELPAPTLIGIPVEQPADQREAGYRALRDGYTRHLLPAAIAQAVGWQCCDSALLFQILVEYQLDELGILEWPIDEADHRRVLESRVRLSDLGNYLRNRFPSEISADRLWELRAAIDFLVNGIPGMSAGDTQRILSQTRTLSQLLNAAAAINLETSSALPGNMDAAWWLYAFGRVRAASEPAAPEIEEELFLSCQAVDGIQNSDVSTLLRFSFDDSRWSEIYRVSGFTWMSSLPDPRTLLIQDFALDAGVWRTNIWRDGAPYTAYISSGDGYSISFGETDPAGEKLVVYSTDSESGDIRGLAVDLANCGDNGCAAAELPGQPVWSPDGERAIYAGDANSFADFPLITVDHSYILLDTARLGKKTLALGPGDAHDGSTELTPLVYGRAPFWIDNQTYGFITSAREIESGDSATQDDEDVIVLAGIDDPAPQLVISTTDLAQFLPDGTVPSPLALRRLTLGYVATHPARPRTLFIVLLHEIEQRAYVFSYDLATRIPQLRMDLLYTVNHSLGFSPDGRYLVLTGQDRRNITSPDNSAVLLLHDIDENQTIPFITRLPFFLPSVIYDWTQDGRRMVTVMEDNLIGIVEPDSGLVQLLPHGYGACASVAWLTP